MIGDSSVYAFGVVVPQVPSLFPIGPLLFFTTSPGSSRFTARSMRGKCACQNLELGLLSGLCLSFQFSKFKLRYWLKSGNRNFTSLGHFYISTSSPSLTSHSDNGNNNSRLLGSHELARPDRSDDAGLALCGADAAVGSAAAGVERVASADARESPSVVCLVCF